MPSHQHFPCKIYLSQLQRSADLARRLNRQISKEAYEIAELDGAGVAWSKEHYPNGFTSYASVNSLQTRSTTFERLETMIDGHVVKFVKDLDLDLGKGRLKMSTCWINVMGKNAHHGLHIHPLSVVSGTYYVQAPKGSAKIKFEDPRLVRMMAAPPRRLNAKKENRLFAEYAPEPGSLVLFESWMPHVVPLHSGNGERISVSFNYEWE